MRKKHWLLETESIDVLLTDITMPEMSGIELIEQAKKKGHQFISLILSGYQEFDYVKKAWLCRSKIIF